MDEDHAGKRRHSGSLAEDQLAPNEPTWVLVRSAMQTFLEG